MYVTDVIWWGFTTLYWPLLVSFDRVPMAGSMAFALGLVVIETSVLLFTYNILRTVLRPGAAHSLRHYLASAFGIDQLRSRLRGRRAQGVASSEEQPPVFIVAVARGSVDTVINAIVFLSAGILLLGFCLPGVLAGVHPDPRAIDSLLYKNWLWWGLDMIADGSVLMYTAGTWYLLVPFLVKRKLYGETVVR